MPAKQTQEEFIEKAKSLHGDLFDYSKVKYVRSSEKVEVICKQHGPFPISPNAHLRGSGCPKCKYSKSASSKKESAKAEFVKLALGLSYRLEIDTDQYKGYNSDIQVRCRIHDLWFTTKPTSLKNQKHSCPKCSSEGTASGIRTTVSNFLIKARHLRGAENVSYPFLDTEFLNSRSEITRSCKIHGDSKVIAGSLMYSVEWACPECQKENAGVDRALSSEEVRNSLQEVHGGKYEFPYVELEYENSRSLLTAICKNHGEFKVSLNGVTSSGTGCPKCGRESTAKLLSRSLDEFVSEASTKYSNLYDYSRITQEHWDNKRNQPLEIVCPKHGSFLQDWRDHLHYCSFGCPSCAKSKSGGEAELLDFLVTDLGLSAQKSRKVLLNPRRELDIYIPDKNLAIEFNGLYFHSGLFLDRNYHRDKRRQCEALGIRLISIWEDEWNGNKGKVKDYLRSQLGIEQKSIHGRKTTAKFIDSLETAQKFIEDNHLLGAGALCQHYIGLYLEEDLVAVFGFRKAFVGWELHRASYKSGSRVLGGLSKAMKLFRSKYKDPVTSYIDRDKFNGDSYYKAGFLKVKESLTLWYSKSSKRYSKFLLRKDRLSKMNGYDPSLTERENCAKFGYYQCFNSGTDTVVLK